MDNDYYEAVDQTEKDEIGIISVYRKNNKINNVLRKVFYEFIVYVLS